MTSPMNSFRMIGTSHLLMYIQSLNHMNVKYPNHDWITDATVYYLGHVHTIKSFSELTLLIIDVICFCYTILYWCSLTIRKSVESMRSSLRCLEIMDTLPYLNMMMFDDICQNITWLLICHQTKNTIYRCLDYEISFGHQLIRFHNIPVMTW